MTNRKDTLEWPSSQPDHHRELALRSQEFLYYQQQGGPEQAQLAEALWFNQAVSYLVSIGFPRPAAELYCENADNLMELAMRLFSSLGPVTG